MDPLPQGPGAILGHFAWLNLRDHLFANLVSSIPYRESCICQNHKWLGPQGCQPVFEATILVRLGLRKPEI